MTADGPPKAAGAPILFYPVVVGFCGRVRSFTPVSGVLPFATVDDALGWARVYARRFPQHNRMQRCMVAAYRNHVRVAIYRLDGRELVR
jgi:hypothetical protein